MKLEWCKEEYIVCCARNERNGLACFKAGVWKLRGTREGSEKGRYPLFREAEDVIHVLVKCLLITGRNSL
jgi:hypothetical protein